MLVRSIPMTSEPKRTTGGCLCGALRYEAFGEPIGSGHCYCVDCRRASGSGFIPFMGFKAEAVRFTGEARQFRSKAANGGDAVRNRCAQCMSLVFGCELRKCDSYTLYASSLHDPQPSTRPRHIRKSHPELAIIPPGFKVFDRISGIGNADPVTGFGFTPQATFRFPRPTHLGLNGDRALARTVKGVQAKTREADEHHRPGRGLRTAFSASTANSAARRWPAAVG